MRAYYDASTTGMTLVSHTSVSAATAAGGNTWGAAISADGQWIAYGSTGDEIVAGQADDDVSYDVFLFSRATSQYTLVSHSAVAAATAADGFSGRPEISADGGRVAFLSDATNLVAGQSDVNGEADVFLYDRATNSSALASRTQGSATTAGNRYSEELSLSADGSFVVFRSDGSNLVSGQADPAGNHDLFLWTRATGTTALVTHQNGAPATSGQGISGSSFRISGDGAWIALASRSETLVSGVDDLNANDDVFLHQRSTGEHTLVTARGGAVSAAAGGSVAYWTATALSNDGRYIAFTSDAPNVVPGATDGNNATDVFLHDRITGEITLVSRAAGLPETAAGGGSRHPLVTSGGAAVLFESDASNLVAGQTAGRTRQLYRWDRATGQTVLVTRSAASPLVPGNGGIWGSGYYAASKDGRWIAFNDYATNLVAGQFDANGGGDVFLHDSATGATTLVSHASSSPAQTANGTSGALAISADGRWLAFQSDASNLLPGSTGAGIFLYDRIAGTTVRASPAGDTWSLALSADGQRLAFFSNATNLVPGQVDTNGSTDVFLWDRATGSTRLVSRAAGSAATAGNGLSHLGPWPIHAPVISADGAWIAFPGRSPDLVSGDHDGVPDAFLHANPLPGRDFFTVTPCRVLDTQPLTSGVERTVTITGACGIPATARAIAVNVTVLQPSDRGRLTLHPGDLAAPLTSTINFAAGETRANNAVLALALDGTGTLSLTPFVIGGVGGGMVHAILDVSGYFQ